MTERRPGNSKLVYDKRLRTIVTVRTPLPERLDEAINALAHSAQADGVIERSTALWVIDEARSASAELTRLRALEEGQIKRQTALEKIRDSRQQGRMTSVEPVDDYITRIKEIARVALLDQPHNQRKEADHAG